MGVDSQHIHVEFHRIAGDILSEAVEEFETTAKNINRRTEEYRFVQLKEKNVHTLKQRLEDAANVLVQKHQHHLQLRELQLSLQQIIKDYLHQFVMKLMTI